MFLSKSMAVHWLRIYLHKLTWNRCSGNKCSASMCFAEDFCHLRWADSGGLIEMQVIKNNSLLSFTSLLHVEWSPWVWLSLPFLIVLRYLLSAGRVEYLLLSCCYCCFLQHIHFLQLSSVHASWWTWLNWDFRTIDMPTHMSETQRLWDHDFCVWYIE